MVLLWVAVLLNRHLLFADLRQSLERWDQCCIGARFWCFRFFFAGSVLAWTSCYESRGYMTSSTDQVFKHDSRDARC
ncbi:hypothetical protein EDB80DRAFT_730244 [Ilyonectria destructans]|nr:hypothetical protein EDB80DRAFT_730244 [Ilyonectria destructans]